MTPSELRKPLLELLREHQKAGADGLPTSARFLFYELTQRGLIPKHKEDEKRGRRSDQNLHDALTYLREHELVPWLWIVDETRSLDDFTGYESLADAVVGMAQYTRLDPWKGRAPLLLIESRSLSGVLRNLAREYCIRIASTNGQTAGFLHTDIAPLLKPGDLVAYAGDWDWQGGQIETNTRRVLERIVVGELDWKRVALTEEQVKRYRLSALQIMKPDRRYKPVRYHPAVETEALSQQVIVAIIRRHLDRALPEPLARVLEREARQRRELLKRLGAGR